MIASSAFHHYYMKKYVAFLPLPSTPIYSCIHAHMSVNTKTVHAQPDTQEGLALQSPLLPSAGASLATSGSGAVTVFMSLNQRRLARNALHVFKNRVGTICDDYG